MKTFSDRVLFWHHQFGRHDLPWQDPREPYPVWVSEIMLQQTQVSTVIPYFTRFMMRFPNIESLAAAPIDEVLKLWAGLGYYARARNLHRAAQLVVEQHGGLFPETSEEIESLPGIGRSTAGAIRAQAFGQRAAILDGNVRRLLARHAAIEGWTGLPKVQQLLWEMAESLLPNDRLADYTQGLMDLGSTVCRARSPDCAACPVRQDCKALEQGRVAALPSPRPKAVRKNKATELLILVNARREFLLCRRPPAGIWGGLWCPPMTEFEPAGGDKPAQSVAPLIEQLGYKHPGAMHRNGSLPPIRHVFTHFDLQITPNLASFKDGHAADSAHLIQESTAKILWCSLDEPEKWPGVPAPIRKLLDQIRRQETLPLQIT